MRSLYEQRRAEATEIEGHLSSGRDKIVTTKFGAVAKVLWPFKTAAQLAAIANVEERSAKRWLSGEFDPPVCISVAVLNETFRKQ